MISYLFLTHPKNTNADGIDQKLRARFQSRDSVRIVIELFGIATPWRKCELPVNGGYHVAINTLLVWPYAESGVGAIILLSICASRRVTAG